MRRGRSYTAKPPGWPLVTLEMAEIDRAWRAREGIVVSELTDEQGRKVAIYPAD